MVRPLPPVDHRLDFDMRLRFELEITFVRLFGEIVFQRAINIDQRRIVVFDEV